MAYVFLRWMDSRICRGSVDVQRFCDSCVYSLVLVFICNLAFLLIVRDFTRGHHGAGAKRQLFHGNVYVFRSNYGVPTFDFDLRGRSFLLRLQNKRHHVFSCVQGGVWNTTA